MTNEVYHILGASIRAAKMGIGHGVIFLIKRPKRGKTQTVKILRRDNMPYVQRIPSGTPAGMYEFLVDTNPAVYFIDDKDKWDRKAFSDGLRYLKGLSDGEKAPLLMTHYTREQTRDPMPSKAWSWVLLNKPQYDSCSPILIETGLNARAIKIRTTHTNKEYARIQSYYHTHGYNPSRLPSLKIHDDWYSPAPRVVTSDEEKIISSEFPEEEQESIFDLCKVLSEDGFYAILECLQVSAAGDYYEEYIEFEEKGGE